MTPGPGIGNASRAPIATLIIVTSETEACYVLGKIYSPSRGVESQFLLHFLIAGAHHN